MIYIYRLTCFDQFLSLEFNVAEDNYFLGDEGKKYCRGGKPITDVTACKKACYYLNIEMSEELKAGEVCYKNGVNKKCDQNGKNGGRASLICEKGNVTP